MVIRGNVPVETVRIRNIHFGKPQNALIVEDSFRSQRSRKVFTDKVRIEFQDCPLFFPPARLSETYLKYRVKREVVGRRKNVIDIF